MGSEDQGSGFKVQGSRFRVQGSGFRGFKVQDSRFNASGQRNGQSNRIRNSCMTNVEYRINGFFLFYLLKIAERSDIHNSSFVIHHSTFHRLLTW
jgi:hypothetical protein